MTPEFGVATKVTFSGMVLFDALDPSQRGRLLAPFTSAHRTHWNFLPEVGRGEHGLALKEMSHRQQLLAHRLIGSSVSIEAYGKILTSIALEHMLREIDEPAIGYLTTEFRDPGNYYLTFFGRPDPDQTWGWRLVGHHVCVNITVVGQEAMTSTPFLLGSEPGRIGSVRPLAEEEDLAFALLGQLTSEQRRRAIFHPVSPPDFVTGVAPHVGDGDVPPRHGVGRRDVVIADADRQALRYVRAEPRGVALGEMSSPATDAFHALLHAYIGRAKEGLQKSEMDRIVAAGVESLHFGWAGAPDYGSGHYYRIQGPVTLIEFNNTEGDANHVHSVWRDLERDFGRELLPRCGDASTPKS